MLKELLLEIIYSIVVLIFKWNPFCRYYKRFECHSNSHTNIKPYEIIKTRGNIYNSIFLCIDLLMGSNDHILQYKNHSIYNVCFVLVYKIDELSPREMQLFGILLQKFTSSAKFIPLCKHKFIIWKEFFVLF